MCAVLPLPGSPIFLESYDDPHLAAVLLKKFLREMPTPLFPSSTYETIARCPPVVASTSETSEWKTYVNDKILRVMHAPERALLSSIFCSSRASPFHLSLLVCRS